MKIVTVCQKGNTRSVALRSLLLKGGKHDVIACGYAVNSRQTLEMLYTWAVS